MVRCNYNYCGKSRATRLTFETSIHSLLASNIIHINDAGTFQRQNDRERAKWELKNSISSKDLVQSSHTHVKIQFLEIFFMKNRCPTPSLPCRSVMMLGLSLERGMHEN